MQVIPVLFCALIAVASAAVVLPAGILFAAPPEEKLPELSKPQLHREKTPLEKAVDRAVAMLLQGKLPANEDGVRFALWLYGEKGDVAYRDVATRMARELVKTDPIMGTAALYWVAQAGGPTLEEAKASESEIYRENPQTADKELMWLAGLSAKREPLPRRGPPGGLSGSSEHKPSMTEIVMGLQNWIELAQLCGSGAGEESARSGIKTIFDKFWDPKTRRYFDPSGPAKFVHAHNTLTALTIWQAGVVFQDAHFREVAQQAVENDLGSALADPNAAAIAGLAAARMSRHHVQLAIIGDPKDTTVTSLRQAAYFLFEPNKVILNLDPAKDQARMAELMYSPDAAPAMFVCVETLCSPPIKNPAELEKQVIEIKKLAAQVEQ